jgi:gamma-glutamylcyclotransferase (GGCT)/AIG2-like uncharacterized protein YtfP
MMTSDATQPPATDQHDRLPLFVYGTLKRGESNYPSFLAGRTRNEQPATLAGAALFSEGAYPYLVVSSDLVAASDSVSGTVMHIQPEHYPTVLQQIDRLEDYIPGDPASEYERIQCQVQTPSGSVIAWTYTAGARALALVRAHVMHRLPAGVWHGYTEHKQQ